MRKDYLSTNDRTVLYGLGVFETLLVANNRVTFPDLHYNRMLDGAQRLGISVPQFDLWQKEIAIFLKEIECPPLCALRVTLSAGTLDGRIPSGLLLQTRPLQYTKEQYLRGMSLYLLPYPRNEFSPLTRIKSTNYMENILARQDAKLHHYDEGLWCNTQGYLTECAMSNLFFVKNKEVYTPSLNCGCLAGTRRSLVVSLAAQLNIAVHEGTYRPQDLFQADEVFLTNALMGIMPVQQIADHRYKVPAFDVTSSIMRQLTQALDKLTCEEHI